MNTIQIRTHLESDTPHLPELKPFIGKTVEITVVEKEPAVGLLPGHGNWDAAIQAARELIADGQYDFDAIRRQDEIDLERANDHPPSY